jgi:hypothetical protein
MSASGHGSTPPHHPTYNVRFSPETIKGILTIACPVQRVLNIETLPSGKSFNNRLYFVDVGLKDRDAPDERSSSDSGDSVQKQSMVLKVSGQFFGPDKVQNEISCLLLLEKHRPDVPVPRIVAWSEDGLTIRCYASAGLFPPMSVSVQDPSSRPGIDIGGRGWVLMTRRPGRLIRVEDLQGPHSASLMRQLARYAAQWRQKMPRPDRIGNVKDVRDASGPQEYDEQCSQTSVELSTNLIVG